MIGGIFRFCKKIARRVYKRSYVEGALNPWAFIRVYNEEKTLKQSLDSIIPAISRGIIVYSGCTDRSKSIIEDFCEKNTGFICAFYPHEVASVNCTKEERQSKKSLSDYYNFALSFIPQGDWLIKIDADQIYDAEKLKKSFYLVKDDDEVVFYFRINLHLIDSKVYIDGDSPVFDPKDHWLICNKGLYFKDVIISEKDNKIVYWELLKIPFKYKYYDAKLSTWHFPYLKTRRQRELNNLIPIKDYKKVIPQEFLDRMDQDMFDEERILKLLENEKIEDNKVG
ncbi:MULTISPECIES: glycosyltransferase [unclassified Helicobacter]|uniref:glycosyltransferase n=1 Tax=unclassified Helicobacter TaxID=2593540 RepID=UPI000CF09C2F|nr:MULTISPECIES: glycosyltransferase [unclassified Helicobacter]